MKILVLSGEDSLCVKALSPEATMRLLATNKIGMARLKGPWSVEDVQPQNPCLQATRFSPSMNCQNSPVIDNPHPHSYYMGSLYTRLLSYCSLIHKHSCAAPWEIESLELWLVVLRYPQILPVAICLSTWPPSYLDLCV